MSGIVIDFTTLPVAERDQALGAYMDSWNTVEKALLMSLWTLARTDFGVARAIFASSNGIAQVRELLIALSDIWLPPPEQGELESLLDKVKALNTKRNRIVHGEWVAHTDNPRAPTRFDRWVRHYHAADHTTFMGALTGDDQKAAANFSFTVQKIEELSSKNREIAALLSAFIAPIRAQMPPLTQPEGRA